METIGRWLERHGLGEYQQAFIEQDVRAVDLPLLTDQDLRELGLPLGPRKRLLAAIDSLRARATDVSDDVPGAAPDASTLAEHRQLSVMFCDLVGSTALSERLDLETYRDLLTAYQDAVRGAIASFDGYIARYMGDGLLVYFGYPSAHEDDAERAVRAGLAVIGAMSALPRADGVQLRARIGIATGPVLVGDLVGKGASEERAVLGETPNLAARLQSLASPNGVVLSESTRRLVEGRFVLEPLPDQRVKGFSEPVRCCEARAIRSTSRFEAATTQGLFRLVGRRGELQVLRERWQQATQGEGQVVLLSGEAGIGKSRILHELRRSTRDEPHIRLAYQCSPFGAQTPFSAIIEHLQSSAGFTQDDSAAQRLDKLEHLLTDAGCDVAATAPLLAPLLGLPGERYAALQMAPQRQKLQTVAVFVEHIERLARKQPVLAMVEDAHWMDPSTLETFEAVVERASALPLLLVVTHRPEFDCPWRQFGHVTQYSLNRLDRGDGGALTDQVTGGRALPDSVLEQILQHTDGVPLFIEELTRTVLEAGLLREVDGRYVLDGPLPPLAIPSTLQDSLMARLDRLAAAREVAQAAACIGREFTTTLLSRVLDRSGLEDDLQQLQEAGLVFQTGIGDVRRYVFKHALVQDTAYESLLSSRRRELHARIAAALETKGESDSGLLAHHYSKAGLAEQAASHFLAEGKRALSVSALAEACSELEMGLREIEALPVTPQSKRLELDLHATLGAARLAYFGWPYPTVASAYRPAYGLAEELRDRHALGPILWGLCVHYWCRAEFAETHRWLARLEAVAELSADSELCVVRDMTAGCQYFWEAYYEKAFGYTERLRETYDERLHGSISTYTNHDPLTFSLHWAGSLLQWITGFPDRALELVDEAHALARRINHPFNSAFALTAGSEALLMRGDTARVLSCCDEVQRIVDEEGLGEFAQLVLVDNWRGRTLTRSGQFAEGYRLTHRATTGWRAAEGKICSAMFWGSEAIALGGLGLLPEALELIDAAIMHCRQTGDRYMEPEVLRVKAELLLAANGAGAACAEALLREALATARAHGARAWELRAATSLASVLHDGGNRARAVDVLAPVFDWFTEGLETADLMQASALLEELC